MKIAYAQNYTFTSSDKQADASACKRAFIFLTRSCIVDKFLIDFYLEK